MTRWGDFCKFLATNFITKVGKMFGDFFGYIEKHHFLSETSCGYFWKDWATFYSYIWSHWRWVLIHCNLSSIIIQLSSGQIKDTGLNIDQLSLGDTCTIGPIIKQKNRLYNLQRAFFITFVVINRQEILKSFPAGKTEYWMTISPLHCEILEPSLHINSSPRVTPLQQVKCL